MKNERRKCIFPPQQDTCWGLYKTAADRKNDTEKKEKKIVKRQKQDLEPIYKTGGSNKNEKNTHAREARLRQIEDDLRARRFVGSHISNAFPRLRILQLIFFAFALLFAQRGHKRTVN